MICRHCKKEIDDDSIFCPECGHEVEMHSNTGSQDSQKQMEEFSKQETRHPIVESNGTVKAKNSWALFGAAGVVLLVILLTAVFLKGGILKNEVSYDNAIDAVHTRNISFRGIVVASEQKYQLSVLEPQAPLSICAVDVNGKEKRADGVYKLALSVTTNIGAYLGKEVWVEGEIGIDGKATVMYVDSVREVEEERVQAETNEDIQPEYMEETEQQMERETELLRSEEDIHEYILCVEDCTWEEAFQRCKEKGGYLVRINTKEEFTYIRNLIKEQGYEKIQFYIGMRRELDEKAYYLVDENNEQIGDRMDNGYTKWCKNIWLSGEPTYRDSVLKIEETCVSLFRYSATGKWVFNDVPEDLIGALSTNKGKVGYICEIE